MIKEKKMISSIPFSLNEIKLVKSSPFIKRVKIHNRILRAETAAVLVLSIYENYQQLLN